MNELLGQKQKFGFNPQLEKAYLSRLPADKRLKVLTAEVTSAVGEASRFSFTSFYDWRDSSIVDRNSGEPLVTVVCRGGREEESTAIMAIENGLLLEENNLMVHISPANDKYRYPKGVVDLWNREGNSVCWRRMTVEDNNQELREIFSDLSGKKIPIESDILSMLIVKTKQEVDAVVQAFKPTQDKTKVTQEEIFEIVSGLVTEFEKKFGASFVLDAEKIFRLFSASIAETSDWIENKLIQIKQIYSIGRSKMDVYLWSPMKLMMRQTFGCDIQTMVGNFVEQGINLVKGIVDKVANLFKKTFDCPKCGQPIEKGKGIKVCPHCGAKKSDYGSTCD